MKFTRTLHSKFTPLAYFKKIANQTITLNSAGKLFNIAGLIVLMP